jgi:hypothetical protein
LSLYPSYILGFAQVNVNFKEISIMKLNYYRILVLIASFLLLTKINADDKEEDVGKDSLKAAAKTVKDLVKFEKLSLRQDDDSSNDEYTSTSKPGEAEEDNESNKNDEIKEEKIKPKPKLKEKLKKRLKQKIRKVKNQLKKLGKKIRNGRKKLKKLIKKPRKAVEILEEEE